MKNMDRVPTIKHCRTISTGAVVLFIICLVLIGWGAWVRTENAAQARRIARLEIDNAALKSALDTAYTIGASHAE